MICDAGENLPEISLRFDIVKLGGFDQRQNAGGTIAAVVGAGEQPVLAAEGRRPFILPMSAKKLRFITAGTRISAGRFASGASTDEPAAWFCKCRGRRMLW